jgi:hypothetical protein
LPLTEAVAVFRVDAASHPANVNPGTVTAVTLRNRQRPGAAGQLRGSRFITRHATPRPPLESDARVAIRCAGNAQIPGLGVGPDQTKAT